MSARAAYSPTKPTLFARHAALAVLLLFLATNGIQAQRKTLTFAITGDIMMEMTFPDSINGSHLPPDDGNNLLSAPLSLLRNADSAAGNLEGPLLEQEGRLKPCKDSTLCYAFRMSPRYVKHLQQAETDFMSLANNHINDFGTGGLRSMQKTLKAAGISYAGVKDVCETTVVKRNGIRFGIAAFGRNAVTPRLTDLARKDFPETPIVIADDARISRK